MGEHVELVSELERLVASHPLREHLHAQLMTALYRSGRQVDALGAFQRARNVLVTQIGVEPGRELRDLELAVLRQAPELEAVPPAGGPRARLVAPLGAGANGSPTVDVGGPVAPAPLARPGRSGLGERLRPGRRRTQLVGAACGIAVLATACTVSLVIAATRARPPVGGGGRRAFE